MIGAIVVHIGHDYVNSMNNGMLIQAQLWDHMIHCDMINIFDCGTKFE